MTEDYKISDSKLRILDALLKCPEMQASFKDLSREIREFSETEIRKSLRGLKKSNILHVDFERGRPKGGCRTEIYTISTDWEAFKTLNEIYIDYNYVFFIISKYFNKIVEFYGFLKVFDQMRKRFFDKNFKKMASRALLEQPSIVREYKNHHNILREIPDYVVTGFPITAFEDEDLINILSFLDPLSAVEFYREKIGDTYIKFYRELAIKNNYITESLKKFIDYDIMLSPLTSYPINDPIYLLFKRPYERIYNNAFIMGPMDRYRFVRRAHTVYSNFADILCSGINTLRIDEMIDLDQRLFNFEQKRRYEAINELEFRKYRPLIELLSERQNNLKNMKDNIETLVRLAIFHWNIAANRFNYIYNTLGNFLERKEDGYKFYIYEDSNDIRIVELQHGKIDEVLDIGELKGDISLLSDLENSFKQLLPCKAFGADITRKPVTYNEILEEVRSKMIEPKLISHIFLFDY
jgi:hypothetical protein